MEFFVVKFCSCTRPQQLNIQWNLHPSAVVSFVRSVWCKNLSSVLEYDYSSAYPITVSSAIGRAYRIYGQGSSTYSYFTSPACSGLENWLLNCSFSTSLCHWIYNVGVRCYGKQILLLVLSIQIRVYTFFHLYSQFWLYWGGCTSCWRRDRDGRKGGGVPQPDMVGC